MTNQYLDNAFERYENKRNISFDIREGINDLYEKYIKRREDSILDAAAAAGAIGALVYADEIDFDAITPQMEEAFSLAFPQRSIESISELDPGQLEGLVSAWKGKYFEVLVRDELNAGASVGDILLEPGQTAVLAESANQPGWDLEILNADGTVAEALQMKATESLSYVQEALEKYPGIDILTTEEVAATGLEGVIGVDMSSEELTQAIQEPMQALIDSPAMDVAESILPGLPFVIIAGREGHRYMVGKKSMNNALDTAFKESLKSGAAMGAGWLAFSMFDSGLISVPTAFLVREFMSASDDKKLIKKEYNRALKELPGRKRLYLS